MKKSFTEISEGEIQDNLERVEQGEPLSIPLRILNGAFKRRYFSKPSFEFKKLICPICKKLFVQKRHKQISCSKKCARAHQLNLFKDYQKALYNIPEVKAKIKAKMKAYYQRPEVKAKKKAYDEVYYQRPEVKAKIKAKKKAYYQRPEVKAKKKAYDEVYYQRPEVKAKMKAYYQRPEVKAKMKAYYQRPEVKAKKKAYDEVYYHTHYKEKDKELA